MDILTGLNKAMDYIEENICEDIDLEAVAKVTSYSPYHFQKIFCYLADMSLSDYIRRRKMTLAALELQNSNIKVIDIADSFTRAFSKLHNVTPSQAKLQGAVLKSFPISIKGEMEMDYRIEELDAFNVVGKRRRFEFDNNADRNPNGIPEFWTELRRNGELVEILTHSDGHFDEAVGVCTNGDSTGLDYLIAIPTKLKQAPKGLELFHFDKNIYAIFHFIGPLHETMPKAEKMIFAEWLPSSGYEPVMTENAADMEVYSKKSHEAKDYEFWVYVPIKKK